MPSKFTYIEGGGEWSALYVDGKLERVGDHYLVVERVMERQDPDSGRDHLQ